MYFVYYSQNQLVYINFDMSYLIGTVYVFLNFNTSEN